MMGAYVPRAGSVSWEGSRDMMGAYVTRGKWILGKGTRFVWNSFRSTFSAPSKRSEAVTDETTCNNNNTL